MDTAARLRGFDLLRAQKTREAHAWPLPRLTDFQVPRLILQPLTYTEGLERRGSRCRQVKGKDSGQMRSKSIDRTEVPPDIPLETLFVFRGPRRHFYLPDAELAEALVVT